MAIVVGATSRLNVPGKVTLDATGGGKVTLGPVPSGQEWAIQRMAVHVTGTNNPMPTVRVFDGDENNPANQIDSSYTGGENASDFGTPLILAGGEFLVFVWAGGVPGSVATCRLIGLQNP